MWHKDLYHKGGCGIRFVEGDQVLIKRDGVGFVGVAFFAVGVDGGAVFLEMWVLIAKEALTGFTVQGFLTKFLSNKSVN